MSQDRPRRFFSLVVLLAMLTGLVAGCAQPMPMAPAAAPAAGSEDAAAAGDEAVAASGEIVNGGTWTEASLSDANNFNPVLVDDSTSGQITSYIFPALIGIDHETGEYSSEGAMAESWTTSEDGLTWTFKLREGVTWSDGEPVTSADFKYTYDAIASDKVQSPRIYMLEGIESIETPDPLTVVVKFAQVKCDALGTNLVLNWLPSHLYQADFSDVMDSPDNEAPRISAGPFLFQSWTRDDNLIVVRNEDYWEGAPHMDGSIIRVVPDPGARLAQLQSGEIDFLEVQPNQLASAEQDPDLTRFQYYDDGFTYLGLNLANPANPQPGRDEEGNLIPQEPHPILGDVRVRQAIAHAIDYQSLIDNVRLGQGYPMGANVLPAIEWAVDKDLKPYEYDLEKAGSLLEEAGWVDSNGDGIREKDGKELKLTLMTNAGNTMREDTGVYLQDQLKQIGINVDFQTMDFGTLIDNMLAQTYDMVISAWTGVGSDPNDDVFWSSQNDVPGSGFNASSYQNPKVEDLLIKGYSVPGCKPEDRAPYYKEIQQIIHDELPFIYLNGTVANAFYNKDWANVDPGPWNFYWNMHQWYKKSLQPVIAP